MIQVFIRYSTALSISNSTVKKITFIVYLEVKGNFSIIILLIKLSKARRN